MAKWTIQDLALIKKMVAQVDSGYLSMRKAAKKYQVTKYQIEKWVTYMHDLSFGSPSPRKLPAAYKPDHEYPSVIDPIEKRQLIEDIYCGKMTKRNASKKYNIPFDVIGVWLNKLPGYRSSSVSGYKVKVDAQIKLQVVRDIQEDKLTMVKAMRVYKVSRSVIRRWVSDYSLFNLDGSICYQMLNNMNPAEQAKELLEQLEKLKQQLEHERMKNEALETLLKVAEEKFGIQIKKKLGPNQ